MKTEVMRELVEALVIGHSITSKEVYNILSKEHGEVSSDLRNIVIEVSRELGCLRDTFADLESHASDEPNISRIEVWYSELNDRISDLDSSIGDMIKKADYLEEAIDA